MASYLQKIIYSMVIGKMTRKMGRVYWFLRKVNIMVFGKMIWKMVKVFSSLMEKHTMDTGKIICETEEEF